MNSFISSFKAPLTALFIILGVEGTLFLYPPNITCFGAHPDLGDVLNGLADLKSSRESDAGALVLGDSTAIYGLRPEELEGFLGCRVENISRTLHYGFKGFKTVLQECLATHRNVRYLIMPLSQRIFAYSDEESLRGGYLDRYLKAHINSDSTRHQGASDWIPSKRLDGEVTRGLFFDPDRVYYGKHSFNGWAAMYEEQRGCLRLPGAFKPTRKAILLAFNLKWQQGRKEQLAELCRWAEEQGLRVLVVMTPISASAQRVLEEIGVMAATRTHLLDIGKALPASVLFDPTIPVYPDDHFLDVVHLNETGNGVYSLHVRKVAGEMGMSPLK